jgi:hypothetical protein
LRGVKIPYENNHKYIDNIEHKMCSDCLNWKPMTTDYFYKNKSNKIDGHHPYCKECAVKRSLKNRDENREENLAKMRTYFIKIYTERPEIVTKQKNNANKRRIEGKYKEWQRNNPDKTKGYNLKRYTNKKHEITGNEWENCKNYFNYRCAYCSLKIEDHFVQYNGKVINGDFHRDHVDDDGSNDLSNCVPSCKSCNTSKGTIELEEWYNESNGNFTIEKLIKIYSWLTEDYLKYKD